MLLKDLVKTFNLEPFAPLGTFGREFDRLVNGFASTVSRQPAVNVAVGSDSIHVTAELPGGDLKKIDVSVEGNTLTLRGELPAEELGEGEVVHRRERVHGKFVRVLDMPVPVNAKKATATFRDGILEIVLPKAEEAVPRKIKVS